MKVMILATAPMLMPSIPGFLFSSRVTFSWDEFIIAFLLSRFEVTLPVEIWDACFGSGLNPEINRHRVALVFPPFPSPCCRCLETLPVRKDKIDDRFGFHRSASQDLCAVSRRLTMSRSISQQANSSSCSGRPAAARPRCCPSSAASCRRRGAGLRSAERT